MRVLILLCCFLLIHRTSASQSLPSPASDRPVYAPLPLRPLVVLLDSGQVIRRPLVGIDTTYYRAVRLKVARADLLEYGRTLSLLQVSQLQAELRRSRQQLLTSGKDFDALADINKQLAGLPLAKPLLVDPHTYIGVGIGAAALVALKLFLLH